jgi:hypothetical protein
VVDGEEILGDRSQRYIRAKRANPRSTVAGTLE